VYNDLGSGSNIDVCVITKDGVEMMRNHEYLQDKTYARKFPKTIPVGTSKVLRERVITRDIPPAEVGVDMMTD
jgi:20S proteasome subunit beta 2